MKEEFLKKFRKLLNNSWKFFYETDIQTDGRKLYIQRSNFIISVRHYKRAAHLQKTCKISGLLTNNGADITLLSDRSTQLQCGPLADNNALNSGSKSKNKVHPATGLNRPKGFQVGEGPGFL